ncbi:MAG: glycosyltransferase, partial [Leptothrix sp. (in: b-proteobacteria)]
MNPSPAGRAPLANERPLRIALLTHSVNPRGGVVHVLELGQALRARGHAVTLIAPAAPGQRLFRDTPCAVELVAVPRASSDLTTTVRERIAALRAHLGHWLLRQPQDVLHAHDGISANALADLAEAGQIGGYLRTVHHVDRFEQPQVQAWEARSIRAATQVLCVSALWAERLLAEHGIQAAQVGNGVDLARFQPQGSPADAALAQRLGIGDVGEHDADGVNPTDGADQPEGARATPRPGTAGRPLILGVGGIEARKNSLGLLQGFARLRRQLPRAQLVIAGGASLLNHDATQTRFRAEAAAAGLAIGPRQPIVLTGALSDADMPALYRCADVLAMPSLL